MIKILHIIQSLSGGGAAREMLNVAAVSSRNGEFEHKIATLRPSGKDGQKLAEEYGICVHEAPSKEVLDALIDKSDIVQVNWWNNPELLEFLNSEIPKARLVIRYHVAGHKPPQNIIREYLDMADYNIVSFDELPVLSSYDAMWKARRFTKILHGADLSRLPEKADKRHKTFNVGYIGTVNFVKMHPEYVSMSSKIEIPEVRFVVCGLGNEPKLMEEIRKQRVEHKFEFKGYTEDIGAIISEMDVFGYPLRPDTYASTDMVLQEVMYAGIPPVVFPYGGLLQTVKNEINGLVVNNAREYKEAIEYLYFKPEVRERLGKNAREYVIKYLGIENTVPQFILAYRKVMQDEKTVHRWGKDCRRSLLDQPIEIEDITGEVSRKAATVLFAESLGEYGTDYKRSMVSREMHEKVNADKSIARMPYLVFQSGLIEYGRYDRKDPFLHLWAGLYLEERGMFDRAIFEYIAAIKLGFAEWRVFWYLARGYKRAGNEQEYLNLWSQLKAKVPGFLDVIGEKTKLYKLGLPDTDDGVKMKRRYRSLNDVPNTRGGNATARNADSIGKFGGDNEREAFEHYKKAVDLDPNNPVNRKNLADIYYAVMGDVDAALEQYGRALSGNPRDINTLLMLGHISVSKKRFDEAEFFYSRILEIEPWNKDANEKLDAIKKRMDEKRQYSEVRY